jgi:hypothetical protein
MASANKSIPFVVSPQVVQRPEPVTQEQLAFILTVRQQIEGLERELAEAQADVQDALQAGAEVEPGMFRTWLIVIERQPETHLVVTP